MSMIMFMDICLCAFSLLFSSSWRIHRERNASHVDHLSLMQAVQDKSEGRFLFLLQRIMFACFLLYR